jgi:multidrug efflux pump subunit AcrA (membrane-fusion protein)
MKRKVMLVILALACALLTGFAQAETTGGQADISLERWAKGTVQAADTVNVFAPVGGQLLPMDLEAGDVVKEGDSLFTVRPLQALAAGDGVIRLLRGSAGDMAEGVIQQYGALCYIDREGVNWVRATVGTAYNKPENRAIVVGETLRVYNGDENDPIELTGTVILVDGKNYVVEIPAGEFDLEDTARLYRGTGDTYNNKDKVGEGKVERATLLPVMAQGMIAAVHVTEGQKVKKGDVLFTLDSASTVYTKPAQPAGTAPRGGVISAIYAQEGQQVMKDQLMLAIEPLDAPEVVVDVDELDIPSVKVGQLMRVKADALGEDTLLGTVIKISPLGISVLDTTKYPVTLSIQNPPESLLPGMHVTAYWGKE